jgi:hypothetical protein
MMMRYLAPVLIALGLGSLAWLGSAQHARERAGGQALTCPDLLGGCPLPDAGGTLTLQFSRPPRNLQAFELRLRGTALPARAQASFHMLGMDMGYNRYDLRPQADGSLQARVTLPICTQDRADWILQLDLDGQRWDIPFVSSN